VRFADLKEFKAVPIPIPIGAMTEKINIESNTLNNLALNKKEKCQRYFSNF